MDKDQITDERLTKLEARVAKLEQGGKKSSKDRVYKVDIDDPKYGDPAVFCDPSGWLKEHPGQEFKGKHYSECPAEYLENLANFLEYLADKDDQTGRKTAKGTSMGWMKRADAAKARAWAARVGGAKEQPAGEVLDDLPF